MQEHIGTLLTTEEVATKLQVHVKTVREWIVSGELQAVNLGQAYRVDERDLIAFLERRKQPRPRRKKQEQEQKQKGQFKFARLIPWKENPSTHEELQS